DIVATARIVDAHLSEYSAVYDGACPGAAILKAYQEQDAGRLTPKQARFLENRYVSERLNLASTQHRWAGADSKPKEEKKEMGHTKKVSLVFSSETALGQVNTFFKSLGLSNVVEIKDGEDETALMRNLALVEAEVKLLRPRAADGDKYRTDLVDEALRQGVRA